MEKLAFIVCPREWRIKGEEWKRERAMLGSEGGRQAVQGGQWLDKIEEAQGDLKEQIWN